LLRVPPTVVSSSVVNVVRGVSRILYLIKNKQIKTLNQVLKIVIK
jgi:hypothetical protein